VGVLLWLNLSASMTSLQCRAAGVTIITHGYNSDASGWVTGMADAIPNYYSFPGTNFTTYKITITHDTATPDTGSYFFSASRSKGSPPLTTDSGEIIVELDWSQLAGGNAPYDFSTYDVAWAVNQELMLTNSITELNGHPLIEFPIHLIGHSRGGSLMNELSCQLGTNGIWVDHLTTLDPHPLNNDGNIDLFFPTDASASNTYENVLFRDNYWQNFPGGFFDFNGESVSGAYDRYLDDQETSGGYANVTGFSVHHSNVHLWYHGTIDLRNPASDTAASITTFERTNWWVGYEDYGSRAGFYYSLIGGGDRLSTDQPVGQGFGMVRDGYNQRWDFGAGTVDNRASLPINNGNWPNIIKFKLTGTNVVAFGQSNSATLFVQGAKLSTTNNTLDIYLDDDFNPYNGNERLVRQLISSGSGSNQVVFGTVSIDLNATNATPGVHALYARITGGGHSRYLYAPEILTVFSSFQPPSLALARDAGGQFRIELTGVPGQRVVLQSSPDLHGWLPLATNWLETNVWSYYDNVSGNDRRFYRATLQ